MTSASLPFRMLVVGDSILWGQGLRDDEKIHVRVAAALQPRLPDRPIQVSLLAHSGAILGEDDDGELAPPLPGPFGGEVPIQQPSVFQQVRAALGGQPRDETVDLVLLGGGVNDVHLVNLLNPLDLWLETRIEDAFYRRLKTLLEIVCLRFPQAVIVVTGYYPFVGESSEIGLARLALGALGFETPTLPEPLGGLIVGALSAADLQSRSYRFRDGAHACIRQVIQELNDILPDVGRRLCFADPQFSDRHAIAAPESLLFGIQPDLTPEDPPEIAAGRAAACAEHAERLNVLERLACPKATVAHPTPAGAQRYADAIVQQVRFALPRLFIDE